MERSPAVRRLSPLVAAGALAVAAGAPGCSGDEPAPTAADLVADLDTVAEQQQFTPAQVRCVADQAARTLDDGELRQFADELDRFDRTQSLAPLSRLSRKTLTEAIADCAIEHADG